MKTFPTTNAYEPKLTQTPPKPAQKMHTLPTAGTEVKLSAVEMAKLRRALKRLSKEHGEAFELPEKKIFLECEGDPLSGDEESGAFCKIGGWYFYFKLNADFAKECNAEIAHAVGDVQQRYWGRDGYYDEVESEQIYWEHRYSWAGIFENFAHKLEFISYE